MAHRDYTTDLKGRGNQHNVMAFVGNGFDLQVLSDYEASIDTRYTSFYHFLKLRSFDGNNPIFQEMERLRTRGAKNWSDVEAVVEQLSTQRDASELFVALREIQGQFSEFLTLAVPSHLLSSLGADSMTDERAITSLLSFLGDLGPDEYKQIQFPTRVNNFDLYNFVFVNFNYTPLFDDFIYLDQEQFNPRPYKTVDRNFAFQGNPKLVDGASVRAGDTFSSYVITEVLHPHGHQSIPRSLLFGIDEPKESLGNTDPRLRLVKSFWAQNDRRYKRLFDDTELYIIFGCSLGETDRWWWRHILESLGKDRIRSNETQFEPELILYWYNEGAQMTQADVLDKFFEGAGVNYNGEIASYIHVVLHDESTDRVWLNTSRTP